MYFTSKIYSLREKTIYPFEHSVTLANYKIHLRKIWRRLHVIDHTIKFAARNIELLTPGSMDFSSL